MGIAVLRDGAEFVARKDVAEGRGAHLADLPDTKRARGRWYLEQVRRDRPLQNTACRLTGPSDSHAGRRYE